MTDFSNKIIVIDPGHGGEYDAFRCGLNGEREEEINLRVGLSLEQLLIEAGATVHMTRRIDRQVSLEARANMALDREADVFVSIHHNSASPIDRELNYSCVFVHGGLEENSSEFALAQHLADTFKGLLHQRSFIFSDHLIFTDGLSVLRQLREKVPAVLGEFSFFSHPAEEEKLKTMVYCEQEAWCYFKALKAFFHQEVYSLTQYEEFENLPIWKKHLETLRKDLLDKDKTTFFNDYYAQADDAFHHEDYKKAAEFYEKSLALLTNSPECQSVISRLSQCYQKLDVVMWADLTCELVERGVVEIF